MMNLARWSCALAVLVACASEASSPLPAETSRLRGVDVSHYQPQVDWARLKPNVSFVFIKATDSRGVDPLFASHWSGARKVGIPRSAYHFFHPKQDVDQQVDTFVKHMKADPGELPPVVDVEEYKAEYQGFTCEQLKDMLQRFSEGVHKQLGRKPIIYTNHQTWRASFCDHAYFTDHLLWLAAYTRQTEPRLPEGWERWHFWQYTETGSVEGIPGAVDQSYFHGAESELKALFATAD
ncbi:glycoside hydrolase family 25 protein [Melittangium boletus]|uniref:glycoside hydrolase family 25 protein n=1 Tax=Melittangium boletus TaxID=83453 RepID=UPI003DA3DAFD